MTPQELKNSILQLAIQGKLVEQRPEEGTAEELYRKIQEEKQRLIKERKLKKEKPLPEIAEVEKPFEIPRSWKWGRFGEMSQFLDGEKLQGVSYPYLEAKYLRGKSDAIFVTGGKFVHNGTKVILVDGENSGEVFHVPEDGYMGSTFKALYYSSSMFEPYVLYFLLYHKFYYRNNKKGSAIPHLNKALFFNMPIPIPPFEEQARIVAKIEEILPYIDRYEQAWNRLEDFNKRFPIDMQKSLLQWAIQGKLVEQRPEEGTAEELYRQIQEEKRRLVKEGKIKKEKPLPEIAEDEVPFEIPKSWKWVNLNRIAESIVDCPHSTPQYLNTATEYCTIDTNCINEKGDITKWRYVNAGTYENRIVRLTPQKDDIIYTREGSICRAAILPDRKKICLGQRVMLIRCANGVFPQFVRKILMSPTVINKLTEQQKGIGAKHINVSDVCNLLLPLPPLAEQKRIVAKLEELLPLCERLK